MRNVICPHQDAAYGTQTSSYTGSSVATTGWKRGPSAVIVFATTDCHVRVGESVTATTADFPLMAYQYVVLDVPPGTGGTWQVAAIRMATSGTLYAKPMSA